MYIQVIKVVQKRAAASHPGFTLHTPSSPITYAVEVKGGPLTRIYLCKRLPNYQSWFSTSLNFLIGLPFWLPLITRFHIPLMIGGRHINARTLRRTHSIHPAQRSDTYAPVSSTLSLFSVARFTRALQHLFLC